MAKFYAPGPDSRTLIVGKTGSGKTVAAIWHLSIRDYDVRPWIIFDYKGDEHIAAIDAEFLQLDDLIPSAPGIYVVRPIPEEDDGAVNKLLRRIWEHENVGIYIDEGYMIPSRSGPFQAILTQGRSKQIPAIILSQRPVWLTRFAISESDYYQIFWLNDERDRKTLDSFLPLSINERLPPYHSWWYDVKRDDMFELGPVKNIDGIIDGINDRLEIIRQAEEFDTRQRPNVL